MNTTRPPKRVVPFAALISLILHGLLLWSVMNLPIAAGSRWASPLFTAPSSDLLATPILRAPDDLFLPDDPLDPANPLLTSTDPAHSPQHQLQQAAQKKLDTLDPAAIPAPATTAPDAAAQSITPDPLPIDPPPIPAAPPAAPIDLSRHLLTLPSPDLALPTFIASTDTVQAPPPAASPLDPAAPISPTQLRALHELLSSPPGTSGPGTSTGLGSLSSLDTASTVPSGLPAAARPATASAPPPPTVKLPPLTSLIPAALPQPDEKTVHLDDDFDYALRLFSRPPRAGFLGVGSESAAPDPWFEVRITPRRSLHRLKPLHKDVVWVLDTSSSIAKPWIDQQRRGVEQALQSLSPGDRFNILQFKDSVTVLSTQGLLPATAENFDKARTFLASAQSSGYTDVNRALGQLITRGTSPDRVYNIILISDGVPTRGPIDARAIINMITRENDLAAAIYCVAFGEKIDRHLLEFLAYRNKGFVAYPTSLNDAAATIRDLAGRLRYPILKDATFDAVGIDVAAIFPRIPRDIYQGQTFSLFGRSRPDTTQLSMRITGTAGPDTLDFSFTLPFQTAAPGDESIPRDWAFWKVHHLYAQIIHQGETPQIKAQIDALKKEYDLKTAY